MSFVTWEELKREFIESNGPGVLWRAEVKRIAGRKVSRYVRQKIPASTFGFVDWDTEDLTQTVLTERLIARKQAEFIFEVSDTIDDARRLLTNEVALADKRIPNQRDNVWGNLEPRLVSRGWTNPPHTDASGNESEIDAIVREVLNLKRLKNMGQERLSSLFASGVLDGLAETIMANYAGASATLLRAALGRALTIISPAMSISSVGTGQEEFSAVQGDASKKKNRVALPAEVSSDLEQEGLFDEMELGIADEICRKLGNEGLEICFLQASQASQSEIASALGVSRPTAVKKIEQTAIAMREAFHELEVEEEGRVRIFQAVLMHIGAGILDGELTR
jgi:hypothetical protein